MRLRTAEIDRYGPLYDCRPPCRDGISVISGPNEAGKTLYLEALLQLLEPDVADVMDPPPRIDQRPAGRAVVEHGGDHYECDGDTSLCEITPVEPAHLQSVFVVRDGDLRLPSDQAYYTSLVEKLGDVHTTEIDAIKSKLKDRGRLTDRRLDISSDRSSDNAGTVRDDAEGLVDDVREYVAEIDADALDELEARRLRVTRHLREAREDLEAQRDAKAVAAHERLSEQLETYRATTERLADLDGYDRGTLDALRESYNDVERDREDLHELEDELEEAERDVAETARTLADLEGRRSELERRESAVADARSAVETYRDQRDDAAGAERLLSVTRPASLVALLAAGGAGVGGAITGFPPAVGLGVALLLVSVVSVVLYYRANQRRTAVETTRETVLRTARDAGFDVESVEDVAPAIESVDREVASVTERVAKTDQQHDDVRGALEDLRAERSELESRIAERERDLEERLADADVASIDEYEERVEAREELEPERRTARRSLVDRFGDPDADAPEENATVWERELDDLVADIDLDEVDAETYDDEERRRLEADVERLDGEFDVLQDRLDDHDDQLDAFDRRARSLGTRPFIGRGLELEARSRDGLEALATELDTVVRRIEADAELSRKALKVFDRIESREEQKLTDLFAPDGPASRTFDRLTGGRYSRVAYDPDTHDLLVERRDGRTFDPDVLSRGTTDQLYVAARVSLARQLLGNAPGFLLLDDPFLAADPARLRQGFQTLQTLADDGWQIIYLTAKEEVGETMVDEHDLAHTELEPLT